MNVNKRELIFGLIATLALPAFAQTDRLPAAGPQKLEPRTTAAHAEERRHG